MIMPEWEGYAKFKDSDSDNGTQKGSINILLLKFYQFGSSNNNLIWFIYSHGSYHFTYDLNYDHVAITISITDSRTISSPNILGSFYLFKCEKQ